MSGISKRLRAARRLRGYPSVMAASKAFGWPSGTYSSRESGVSPPTEKTLPIYVQAFGVSAGWLVTGKPETEDDRAAAEFLVHSKKRMFLRPGADVQRAASALRAVRLMHGFASGSAAARAYGWCISTYTNHEAGRAPITGRMAEVYAFAYGARRAWFDPQTDAATIDMSAVAVQSPRPRRLVEDFAARIAVSDFARRPSVDWVPVYTAAGVRARFHSVGESEADIEPAEFMPLAHGFMAARFDVEVQNVVGVDVQRSENGVPHWTRYLLDASPEGREDGPWLEIDTAGGSKVVPETGSAAGPSVRYPDARSTGAGLRARFGIVATLNVLAPAFPAAGADAPGGRSIARRSCGKTSDRRAANIDGTVRQEENQRTRKALRNC